MTFRDRVHAIGRWWSAARPGDPDREVSGATLAEEAAETIHVSAPAAAMDDVASEPAPVEKPEDEADDDAPDELLVTEVALSEVGPPLANRLAALEALEVRANGHDLPLPTGPALGALLATLQGRLWVVGNPEKPVGWALLDWTADAEVGRIHGVVHPKRRDGEASALLFDAVLAGATEQELVDLCAEAYDDSAAQAWLRRRGFTETVTPPYAVRRLDLARTHERRRRVTEDSLIYATDYRLVRVPGEPADGHVELSVQARLISSGAEAGRASLVVSDDTPEHAHDGATWVLGPHRGHRLGLLMKSDLLTWLESERPRVRAVRSRTPLDDPHLVALSDRLGSRVVGVMRELRRPV